MPVYKEDSESFQDRIKRIQSPRNRFYYDRDTKMHVPKRVPRNMIGKRRPTTSALGALIVSLLIGGLAMMGGQILRIRYFDLPTGDPIGVYLEFLAAFWILLVVSAVMDRRTAIARSAQVVGLFAFLVAGHNLIWEYPNVMSPLYSQEHVTEVLDTTQNTTIIAFGETYGL